MTKFIIKNGKIKISFILVFFNLSALFTYLFKLSWNHQLKYCTRLCKIHFMFHLCCWFSSAVTDKPMIMSDKSLIKSRKTIKSLNARLNCFVFFFFLTKNVTLYILRNHFCIAEGNYRKTISI